MLKSKKEYEEILYNKFKIKNFYDQQWYIIKDILQGKRVLFIAKTGYGKSLCFQFPAIIFNGITVVFTPLIALMRDQVKKLKELGIQAECIYYQLNQDEKNRIYDIALKNKIKILYIAPERQENNQWVELSKALNLSMIVIDEAHCISTWGHDFRPSYRRLINLVNLLPEHLPVLATTATATKRVEKDIQKQIKSNLNIFRGDLKRENFSLNVIHVNSEEKKMIWLADFLSRIQGTGIVYAGTRVETKILYEWLKFNNISTVFYNAGLTEDERKRIENGLITNQWKCFVSTNALGMGIDKPNIRFIIHTQFPQSPIHYYQEIGRAGRDNKPTEIHLLYDVNDIDLPKSFIENARPPKSKYLNVIELIKQNRERFNNLVNKSNLKQTKLKIILNDLIDQKIIIKNYPFYEYRYNAPKLNYEKFNDIKILKYAELDSIIEYANLKTCRMKFLCNFLGDNFEGKCNNCDNDKNIKNEIIVTEFWKNKIEQFQNNYFPVLEIEKKNNTVIKNGIASSYYGFSKIGEIIHKCKYETKVDFPDFILKIVTNAYNKKLKEFNFDLILFVPPTETENLVKNFIIRLSKQINIPFSEALVKNRKTHPQKNFESIISKKQNVKDAFQLSDKTIVLNKNVLIFDDIYDSGKTIDKIAKYLYNCKANLIVPFNIAKTIGG